MKIFLLLSFSALLLGGCAVDPEERAFFDRGWVHPQELDVPDQHHGPAAPDEPHRAMKSDPLIDG